MTKIEPAESPDRQWHGILTNDHGMEAEVFGTLEVDIYEDNTRWAYPPVEYIRTDLSQSALAALQGLAVKLLAEAYEDEMWLIYHSVGSENGGVWHNCGLSDAECLARDCGFDPDDGRYIADEIRAAIPNAAMKKAIKALTQPMKDGE